MSFSTNVREELSHTAVRRQCCALAEIGGMVLGCGGLSYRGKNRYGLVIQTENSAVSGRYFSMCQRWLNAVCEIHAVKTQQLGERTRYVLIPKDEDIPGMLDKLGLLDGRAPFGMRSTLPDAMFAHDECIIAFLRGIFLACGTVGNPEKAYQMEFAVGDEYLADQIRTRLMQIDIPAKQSVRKSQFVVYLKDGEYIAQALGLLGAHKALTDIESIRVMKSMRNDVNRQVNCDNNNLEKALLASERQTSMIQSIIKKIGMEAMPEPLREIAALRLNYPDATLSELGKLLDPPLGKSGVNARMRKLELLAEELANRP